MCQAASQLVTNVWSTRHVLCKTKRSNRHMWRVDWQPFYHCATKQQKSEISGTTDGQQYNDGTGRTHGRYLWMSMVTVTGTLAGTIFCR